MGYALFAQKKLVLTGQLNCLQLQQTQRSDEQYNLATMNRNLQQRLTSMQSAQAGELADYYRLLSASSEDGGSMDMEIIGDVNELSDSAKKLLQKDKNGKYKNTDQINSAIKGKELEFQRKIDAINNEIYQISVKENAIEMAVKRLDTQVDVIQKELDKFMEAEAAGIERSIPKFKGLG